MPFSYFWSFDFSNPRANFVKKKTLFGTETSCLQVKFYYRVAFHNIIVILSYVYKSDLCKLLVNRNSKFDDT